MVGGGYNFFDCKECLGDNIVTNPPYKFSIEWVLHSLELLQPGKKLALFLPIQFFESDSRYKKIFKKYPPKTVYVCSSRIKCAIKGDFNNIGSGAMAYAWFVWQKGYKGPTEVKWFN